MSLSDIAVLIGNPVTHSLSPVFQQAAFDHMSINVRYEAWETHADELKQKIALFGILIIKNILIFVQWV